METWLKYFLAFAGGSALCIIGFLKHLATVTHLRQYRRTALVLQLEFDYSKSPGTLESAMKKDQAAHDEAAAMICEKLGKFNKGELKVVRREIEEMDADVTYTMPCPPEFPEHRTVIEMFYCRHSTKTIARITTHLKCYDGVVCTGAAMNVVEILEGKEPTPPAIGAPNPHFQYGFWTFWNYLKVAARLQRSALFSLPRFLMDKSFFPANPLAVLRSQGPRDWFQYSNPALSFKEIRDLAQKIMDRVGATHVVYTFNQAHERPTGSCSVAMGAMTHVKDLSDKQLKLNHVFTPTMFVDVDNSFAAIVSNGLFWNNYGKHDNEIAATVTGFRWWMIGTPDCMCPIMTIASIQGKVHLLLTIPRQLQPKVADLVGKLGDNCKKIKGPSDLDAFYHAHPDVIPDRHL